MFFLKLFPVFFPDTLALEPETFGESLFLTHFLVSDDSHSTVVMTLGVFCHTPKIIETKKWVLSHSLFFFRVHELGTSRIELRNCGLIESHSRSTNE